MTVDIDKGAIMNYYKVKSDSNTTFIRAFSHEHAEMIAKRIFEWKDIDTYLVQESEIEWFGLHKVINLDGEFDFLGIE
ncbi:hypothetical protein [Halalkalibacter oceani]|uniref:hypothetical protein n=1 Tax=Halalkalibacter oceani TaxID=1653776 RepID=UPI00339AD08F